MVYIINMFCILRLHYYEKLSKTFHLQRQVTQMHTHIGIYTRDIQ